MPAMSSLFPTKYGNIAAPAVKQADRQPLNRKPLQRKRRGSRASGTNPRALGTNPKAQKYFGKGQHLQEKKSNWGDRSWRMAEIARRSAKNTAKHEAPEPALARASPAQLAGSQRCRDPGSAPSSDALAKLGSEQRAVLCAAVTERANIFFTGNAGTGKSHLLRVLVAELRRVHDERSVFVTASTGIAAANVGGTTIHSFAGIGFGDDSAEALLGRMGRQARARWHACKVLVLDELSMLDGQLLDKIDAIARSIRASHHGEGLEHKPFGGIQVAPPSPPSRYRPPLCLCRSVARSLVSD